MEEEQLALVAAAAAVAIEEENLITKERFAMRRQKNQPNRKKHKN